jgi:hypothetical protein
MAEPGRDRARDGGAHLRASHADREQVIGVLKAAYVYGLVTKAEFDGRVSRTLASRTYAELALVTADIPAGLPALPPPPAGPAAERVPIRPGDGGVLAAAVVTFVVLTAGAVMPGPTSGLLFLLAAVIAAASLGLIHRQQRAGPLDRTPGGQQGQPSR